MKQKAYVVGPVCTKANVIYVFGIKGLKQGGVVTNGQLSYDIWILVIEIE